jgi:predicted DNA-binding transcriptional regulator AlpA
MQVSSHEDVRTDRDDRVLTLRQWCALNSLSFDTGKRIIKSGQGPRVMQLSSRRIGIRVSDNRAWQEGRLRA